MELAVKLIKVIETSGNNPQLIFSSSTQETRDNAYGRGKKEARKLFLDWSRDKDSRFSGLVIPNVFGPFGKPYYNSVVATFCHQLNLGEEPRIKVDADLELIYVADLVKYIMDIIDKETSGQEIMVPPTGTMKVSAILSLLNGYKSGYLSDHVIPGFNSPLEAALFNTLMSYRNEGEHSVSLALHEDKRGHLFEIVKGESGGQSFFSLTKPGITRGNHFHTHKVERFCVVQGEAVIRLRKLGSREIIEFPVSGSSPTALDIPVFYTHNITNTGDSELLTLFWSNEIFNPEDPDTYYKEV